MKLKDFLTKEEQEKLLNFVYENPNDILDYKIEGKNISNTLTEKQKLEKLEKWCGKL